jgi:hypothetical protein
MKENVWTRSRDVMMAMIAGAVLIGNSVYFSNEARAEEVVSQAIPSDLDQMKAFEINAFKTTILAKGLTASLQEAIRCGHWQHPGERRAFMLEMKHLHDSNETLISDSENYAPSMAKHKDAKVAGLFNEASAQVDILMDTEHKLVVEYQKLITEQMHVKKGMEAFPVDDVSCVK